MLGNTGELKNHGDFVRLLSCDVFSISKMRGPNKPIDNLTKKELRMVLDQNFDQTQPIALLELNEIAQHAMRILPIKDSLTNDHDLKIITINTRFS